MKIGLDLRCLPADGSPGGGIAHAARALCSRLVLDRSFEWVFYLPIGASFPLLDKEGLGVVSVIKLDNPSGSSLRRAMREKPCDLSFVPSGAVPLGIGVPAVPWIHDLIILDHPEWFPESWLRRQYTTRLVLRGIKRAPVVFAVSEYTKSAIVRHARIPVESIVVTGEGGDETLAGIANDQLPMTKKRALEFVKNKWHIDSPFVLALGTVEPRKNLGMLIRAWAKSQDDVGGRRQKEGGRIELVVAGPWGWKCEDVKREIASLPSDLKKLLYRIEKISDDGKRQLLLAASAVAVPSLDEGFGLVALEALQAGTQVISSNRGAVPEVVGTGAMSLDPLDESAWMTAIVKSSQIERPKIFNSVGLAAAVNALKGGPTVIQHSATVMSAAPIAESQGVRDAILKRYSWNLAASAVLDGLKRSV